MVKLSTSDYHKNCLSEAQSLPKMSQFFALRSSKRCHRLRSAPVTPRKPTLHAADSGLASPPDCDIAVGIASLKANQQVLIGFGGLDRDPEAL